MFVLSGALFSKLSVLSTENRQPATAYRLLAREAYQQNKDEKDEELRNKSRKKLESTALGFWFGWW